VNLTQLFDVSLIGRRDVVGLEFGGRTFTFGDLETRSNQLAQSLVRRGLRGGTGWRSTWRMAWRRSTCTWRA